ncbi:Cyanoglobin Hemoglobin-like protein HbN [Patulibacter medicamentivorans]|jgi:hemoglobin|uniref:Group 1 truncated hemoglobin n=1 Tax=Patulibacter medicamentivorans TaxID=1097667 RepID=H0EBK8_9ACTN|nr:group 1 truncated hemoglobin [Patulibacter medicamentivorans]EHN08930.1 Cyanoglobin Hemoglobin-like protein HbN [Patulibacter medicamentivorans]
MPDHPTLFEQIGGAPAVAAAVDRFYELVWADELLAPYFTEVDGDQLKRHQRAFLSVALGGNVNAYVGRAMDRAHAGLGITDEAFDRVVGHLVATLQELRVGAEQVAQIGAALAPLRDAIVERPAERAA